MNNIDKIQYSKEDIAILGRLVSVANDGVVASAWQIWDDLLKEWQGELNKRFNSSIQYLDINTSTLGVELQALKDEVAQIKMGGIVDIIVNGEHMRDGSDLVVDLGTVIREHQSLDNYYTKDQLYTKADLYTKDRLYTKDDLYTKEEVDYFIQVIPKLDKIVLDQLPSDWSEYADNLVLIPAETTGENDYYDEYIVIVTEVEMPDGFKRLVYTPEKIGTTRVDLSRYATKEDLLSSESQLRDEMQEIYVDTQNTWNAWQLVKNRPNGWAGLDTAGKIPSSIIPNLSGTYISTSQRGAANGVATLDGSGKVSASQLPALNYIPTSQKGAANGVAELNNEGKVPTAQAQFALRGNLVAADIDSTTLQTGFYRIVGQQLGSDILGGDQANGVLIQYSDGYKEQMLMVGRTAGAAAGEQVETYTRRYLPGAGRWTAWYKAGGDGTFDDIYVVHIRPVGSTLTLVEPIQEVFDARDAGKTIVGIVEGERMGGVLNYIPGKDEAGMIPLGCVYYVNIGAMGYDAYYIFNGQDNIVKESFSFNLGKMTDAEANSGNLTTAKTIAPSTLKSAILYHTSNKADVDTVYTKSEVDQIISEATTPQIQSDWSQVDSTELDYIKNKPIFTIRGYLNSSSTWVPRDPNDENMVRKSLENGSLTQVAISDSVSDSVYKCAQLIRIQDESSQQQYVFARICNDEPGSFVYITYTITVSPSTVTYTYFSEAIPSD